MAAIWDDFDRYKDFHAAKAFLDEMGIDYVNRKVDPRKGYDNSMTIDLTGEVGPEKLRQVSVRGTVAASHERGTTVCMVTHDPRYHSYAQRTIHLFDGQVVDESVTREAAVLR